MVRRRSILAFLARFLVLYALLIAPWPGVTSAFRSAYCACGGAVLNVLHRDVAVRLEPVATPTAAFDTHLRVVNRRTDGGYLLAVHSRTEAFVPLVVLVALVLATPIPWRRRLGSLAVGMAVLFAILFARHLLMVVFACAQPSTGLLKPTYPWDMLLTTSMKVAAADIVTSMAITFLVWLVVCFRPRDWGPWIRGEPSGSVDSGPDERSAPSGSHQAGRTKGNRCRRRPRRAIDSE